MQIFLYRQLHQQQQQTAMAASNAAVLCTNCASGRGLRSHLQQDMSSTAGTSSSRQSCQLISATKQCKQQCKQGAMVPMCDKPPFPLALSGQADCGQDSTSNRLWLSPSVPAPAKDNCPCKDNCLCSCLCTTAAAPAWHCSCQRQCSPSKQLNIHMSVVEQ